MHFDKVVLQDKEPNIDALWAKPDKDKIGLFIYNNGKWVPLSSKSNFTYEDLTEEQKEALKGADGNGIASIVKISSSSEDGGINIWRITETNGNVTDIPIANGKTGATGATGPQGPQGDSVLVGQGDLPLAHVLGQDNTKAMSQKGVTDEFLKVKYITIASNINENATDTGNIALNTWYTPNANSGNQVYGTGKYVSLNSYKGKTLVITPNAARESYYAFVTANYPGNASPVSYAGSTTLSSCATKALVTIPNVDGNIYLWFSNIRVGLDSLPQQIDVTEAITERVLSNTSRVESLEDRQTITENSIDMMDVASLPLPPDNTGFPFENQTGQIIDTGTRYEWRSGSDTKIGIQIPISAYKGKQLVITPRAWTSMQYAFLQSSAVINAQVAFADGKTAPSSTSAIKHVVIPDDAEYFFCYFKAGGGIITPQSLVVKGKMSEEINKIKAIGSTVTYHVDEANGSDDNNGLTQQSSFATIAKALSLSGDNVSLELHGTIRQAINITGKDKVIIKGGNINVGTKIDDAELADGYDDVYVKEMASFPSGFSTFGIWLWQHGVNDTSTEILADDVHPLQKGRTYRMPATCIRKANSVEDVAESDTPKYYYDSANGMLYFKIVSGTSLASKPVYLRANDYAINVSCNELYMQNVYTLYGGVHVNAVKAEITSCTTLYGINGFRWENTGLTTLTRCEAAGCFDASGNGDGFGSSVGNATLIDCWGHDCFDDGYSEHGGSQTTIIGGLYEYNGKAGLAPSSMRLNAYNVVCRYNSTSSATYKAGILAVKGSDIPCYVNLSGCVCYGNMYNYYIEGANSVMCLKDCQSENATNIAYYARNCKMVMRNCSDTGSPTIKSGYFTIKNGTVISLPMNRITPQESLQRLSSATMQGMANNESLKIFTN